MQKTEMFEKIAELKNKYGSENAFLFTDPKEIFYLSGAAFDGFWMLFIKEQLYVLCSAMVESQAREFFASAAHIYIGMPLSAAVRDMLKQNQAAILIADSKYMNAEEFFAIDGKLKEEKIKFVVKSGILDELRAVKSAVETEKIRKSCQIASKVCDEIRKLLKPGLSEIEIHYKIIEFFAQNQVKESFAPIVAAGANSANPHHVSSGYKIKQDDIVMIDLGCVYEGYCSDLTRTYFLGKINEKFKKIWGTVQESQNAVLKGIKAGLPVSWADKTARSVISAAGFEHRFIHTVGHGIGTEVHEMPSLSAKAEGVFFKGMTVTVEPGIYLEGEFGARIEDTILITKDGCEVLTKAAY